MRKYLFTPLIVLFISFNLHSQNRGLEWAKSFGGSSDDGAASIAIDASGSVYSTGFFMGTVDLDPGPGTYNVTSNGVYDVFITKLDASGNFIWAKQIGGTGYDGGISIAIDATNHVYVTGYFSDVVDMDPGPGTLTFSSKGNEDIYLLKLDAAGNFIWAKNFGGTQSDNSISMVIDSSANLYITGGFGGTVDFDPSLNGNFPLSSNGGVDIFVLKMDSSSKFIWAKKIGGLYTDYGNDIALDKTGENIYLTGTFQGSMDFDPNSGTFTQISQGNIDLFIARWDSAGNFVWVKPIGGSDNDYGNSIAIDTLNTIYLGGTFEGTVDFDPITSSYLFSNGLADGFIAKFQPTGQFNWVKQIGGSALDRVQAIAISQSNEIYSIGFFSSTVDFDPGAGTFNGTSNGIEDIFVMKLNGQGDYEWSALMGNSGTDQGYSIAVSNTNNVYSSGWFGSTVDFDPSTAVHNLSSYGGYDAFVQKINSWPVGVDEKETASLTRIYPNPTHGMININFPASERITKVEIYTSTGELVKQQSVWSNYISIDLSEYTSGVYILKAMNVKNVVVTREILKN